MKLPSICSPALLIAIAFGLASCAESDVPRQDVFQDSDFKGYGGSGSNAVVGRAFVVMRDHSERAASEELVQVTPANDYTAELVTKGFARTGTLTPPDPRLEKYIRSARSDAAGDFAFHRLPDGEYYVTSAAYFTHWFWNDDLTQKIVMNDCVPMYARVALRGGRTVRVGVWSYGRHTSK